MEIQLFPARSEEFEQVYHLMEQAFPNTERRLKKDQQQLFQKKEYRLAVCREEQANVCAFMSYWEFETFCFAEHFAVSEHLRGQKIGEKLFRQFLKEHQNSVILEVEPPNTEIARRRIGFYQRMGCILNEFPYLQPPLQSGCPAIPLMIMSYPKAIEETSFFSYRDKLYHKVYQTTPEDLKRGL